MGSDCENELKHWREEAAKYKKELEASQEEFSEFERDSKLLEQELEKQLDQVESRNKELASANERLLSERDSLRERLDSVQHESRRQVGHLEDELGKVTGQRNELQRYIRELEQANDDLDRAKRNAVTSLEEFEKKLNEAIERNALLESELDEKDALQTHIERLRQETRDLRQELGVKDHQKKIEVPSYDVEMTPAPPITTAGPTPIKPHGVKSTTRPSAEVKPSKIPSTRSAASASAIPRSATIDASHALGQAPPSHGLMHSAGVSSSPLTASARISALNIVGDLLRKVGALETKLATCRKFAAQTRPR